MNNKWKLDNFIQMKWMEGNKIELSFEESPIPNIILNFARWRTEF